MHDNNRLTISWPPQPYSHSYKALKCQDVTIEKSPLSQLVLRLSSLTTTKATKPQDTTGPTKLSQSKENNLSRIGKTKLTSMLVCLEPNICPLWLVENEEKHGLCTQWAQHVHRNWPRERSRHSCIFSYIARTIKTYGLFSSPKFKKRIQRFWNQNRKGKNPISKKTLSCKICGFLTHL